MTEVAREKVRNRVGVATTAATDRKEPAVCPTDSEAITPRAKTRTWDYVWRSGVSGGLAGCAVSLFPWWRSA